MRSPDDSRYDSGGMTTAILESMMTPQERRDAARTRALRVWEQRRERTEAVEVNLPAHLIPAWRKVCWTTLIPAGTAHEQFEAFMHYVHEHAVEVEVEAADAVDAQVEDMIAEYQGRVAQGRAA